MPRVDRSPSSSVQQLCEWFESRNEHSPRSSSSSSPSRAADTPGLLPRMDGGGSAAAAPSVSPVDEIRAKFLHNLRMFEQCQRGAAQGGAAVFHGSSPALHRPVDLSPSPVFSPVVPPTSVGPSPAGCCSVDVSPSRSSGKTSPQSCVSDTNSCPSPRRCEDGSSRTDTQRNGSSSSQFSGNVFVAADRAKDSSSSAAHQLRNGAHSARHSHQPVIRERRGDTDREAGRCRHSKKGPLFRVLASQSGPRGRLHRDCVKASPQVGVAATPHTHPQTDVSGSTEASPQVCFQSRRRQSVADLQDLLHPSRRDHRRSSDLMADSCPSAPRSRMVSTASIQLRKHSLPVSRKRSSSEERRISVIRTSKCWPETLSKPSPMLDEWLSSLVKQARVLPHEDDMESEEGEESLPVRQRPFASLCSDSQWHYTKKCSSYRQSELSADGTSEQRVHPCVSSKHAGLSGGSTTRCSDQTNSPHAVLSGEHPDRRRTSKDSNSVQPNKCERRGSEDKLSPQSSVTGATSITTPTTTTTTTPTPSIPIHVTEEDEDSACVQSVSDSASVQLCVPVSEDPCSSPRQHLPLSPCSSLGSYHSAISSNADSAVDMALPDDDSSELEAAVASTQEGGAGLDVASKLQQALLTRTSATSTSSSSSSSCHTLAAADSSLGLPCPPSSSAFGLPCPPSTSSSSASKGVHEGGEDPSALSLKLELPSFLISDHSSAECSSGGQAQESSAESPDLLEGYLREGTRALEPGCSLTRSPSATSSSSEGSYCSTCWTDSSVSDAELPARRPERKRKQSSWKKIRSIIRWSPFIQVFKKHRYPWIQLAGHQGNFQAGEAGSVLKKLDNREHQSFQRLMHDRLQPYVPEFRGVVEKNGERYVQLQDLLCEFNSPCVMDIKMGIRTYLEEELTKARKKPTLRKDMYQKMVDVDSNAPTADEHSQRAVTKPRYMQWRDQMSSSVNLGFRIEGIKKSDGASSKDFKKTKSRDSVAEILKSFIGDDEIILTKYLQRLRDICATQESSEFFQSHEVIGSSLLFVHDSQGMVNVWMIDFGKTDPLPKGVAIDHRATWVEGNHEDGYLFGLDNIISILEDMQASSMA
ncbi:uncharacterized protein LOC143281220 [Babylonia areolata]|uniref:uncharacterized protein LOC143281220 n=1 Tax=Babylonia areolata TaxID=304850 RepID=UPI003FD38FC1